MPFEYEPDDSRRRIVITFEGVFRMSEALASIERRRAENTWSYAVLYDIRHMAGHPNMEELRQLLDADASVCSGDQPRGPLAIVATASSLYTKACTFAWLTQSRLKVGVFRDVGEAHSWLNEYAEEQSRLQGIAG